MRCVISEQLDAYYNEIERKTHRCITCGSDELNDEDIECIDCLNISCKTLNNDVFKNMPSFMAKDYPESEIYF